MRALYNFLGGVFALVLLMLTTGCNLEEGEAGVSSSAESEVTLERISISASPSATKAESKLTLVVGTKMQLFAIGHYSDGSLKQLTELDLKAWHSSHKPVASFTAPGMLSASNTPGPITVSVKKGTFRSTRTVEVIKASVSSLNLSPKSISLPLGQSQSLKVVAHYNNNTQVDVTKLVTWKTAPNSNVVSISANGVLSGDQVGYTTLTASLNGFNQPSNAVNVTVNKLTVSSLKISPLSVSLATGQSQSLKAEATYNDGNVSDVSSSVTWTMKSNNGINDSATVTSTGLLSGWQVDTATVSAEIDGVNSDNSIAVSVSACQAKGSDCLDFFDTGNGTLYTNSPSKAFLDGIGGSTTNGFTQEIIKSGPSGDFYLFFWNSADSLCTTYNTRNLAARSNWRLPKNGELNALFNTYGNMFNSRGWPARINYWSESRRGPGAYNLNLAHGRGGNSLLDNDFYATCISEP